MGKLRDLLNEATTEKHGTGAGKRSASRLALIVGLSVFGFIMLEAQVVVVGILADWWAWADVSGYFTWSGTFAGGTIVPYAAKYIMSWKGGKE